MISLPSQQKKLPGGQQDQGHEVVLHDQGEGYQLPKTIRIGNSKVTLGVKEVSQFQIPNWDQNPIFFLIYKAACS